ncbi:MAG TPA: hypothetical protein VFI67_01660 [Sphingomicrobium sp.]|nr:hypothetical protein [Sphingomicrobium sp.]
MWRMVASIVAGLAAWVVVVTILNFGLRAAIPDYRAAEATLQFTLAMKIGRLIEAAMTSLAAGAVIGWIDPSRRWTPWLVGAIVLAAFLPVHVKLWNSFPAWYHLSFLVPLVPLLVIGAALVRGSGSRQPLTAS